MIQFNETAEGKSLFIRQEKPEELQEVVYQMLNTSLFQTVGGKVDIDCQLLDGQFDAESYFKYAFLSLMKLYQDFLEDGEQVSLITVMHQLNELAIEELMKATAEMTASEILERVDQFIDEFNPKGE